jgi:hypothetical protein
MVVVGKRRHPSMTLTDHWMVFTNEKKRTAVMKIKMFRMDVKNGPTIATTITTTDLLHVFLY